ncbi:hypothetical protein [Mesorhizobium sp.]|uniref:hypothetical protein n=1 Tax=Mesorhizobium sp. TaxID=1871066 RepID=UPI00121631C3|nr:hypothetical protein [Mesorhizobium sp.]TIV60223.1 MAG: hypothetical protein E5V80_10610 [Mesorhizobium sp.]
MRTARASRPLDSVSRKLVSQSGGYSCERRRYCSQISSCHEGQWYLHNCSWGRTLDRDTEPADGLISGDEEAAYGDQAYYAPARHARLKQAGIKDRLMQQQQRLRTPSQGIVLCERPQIQLPAAMPPQVKAASADAEASVTGLASEQSQSSDHPARCYRRRLQHSHARSADLTEIVEPLLKARSKLCARDVCPAGHFNSPGWGQSNSPTCKAGQEVDLLV